MMRFNATPTTDWICILNTQLEERNEIATPYALGFYVIYIAIPTAMARTQFFYNPVCTLQRPW